MIDVYAENTSICFLVLGTLYERLFLSSFCALTLYLQFPSYKKNFFFILLF